MDRQRNRQNICAFLNELMVIQDEIGRGLYAPDAGTLLSLCQEGVAFGQKLLDADDKSWQEET